MSGDTKRILIFAVACVIAWVIWPEKINSTPLSGVMFGDLMKAIWSVVTVIAGIWYIIIDAQREVERREEERIRKSLEVGAGIDAP